MATKKKIIVLRIKTPDAISEVNRIVSAKFNPIKTDLSKGSFLFIHKFGFQKIKVSAITKAHKGVTVVQVIAKSDDLIGTGCNKAISILEQELKNIEPNYLVDFEIVVAFQKILKGDYSGSYKTLLDARNNRPKDFKLNYGLALCYVAKNDMNKAREYIFRALSEISPKEDSAYRKRIAVKFYKLNSFQLSSEIFEQIYESEKSNTEVSYFYYKLLLKSGDLKKLFYEITKEFKNDRTYLLKLLNDKSISKIEKEDIQRNRPILIKSIRKNTIFNLSSPGIIYLLENNQKELPLKFRDVVFSFYKKQKITFGELVKLYNSGISLSKLIEAKSIDHLSNSYEPQLLNFKKQVENLNKLVSLENNTLKINGLNELVNEINDTLVNLESSARFTLLKETFLKCNILSEKISDVIHSSKEKVEGALGVKLVRRDIAGAKQVFNCYCELYDDEEKVNLFRGKVFDLDKSLKEASDKKRKVILYGSVISVGLIFMFLLVSWLLKVDSNPTENIGTDLSKGKSKFEIIRDVSDYNYSNLDYTGEIVNQKMWNDSNGINIVLFTKETEELFVFHFVVEDENPKILKKVQDFEHNCEFDLYIDFIANSIAVSDLDNDGFGEISFAYKKSCASDLSPKELKLIMLENGEKYIIKGTTVLNFNGNKRGGEKNIDNSFKNAPEEFLTNSNKIWDIIVEEEFSHSGMDNKNTTKVPFDSKYLDLKLVNADCYEGNECRFEFEDPHGNRLSFDWFLEPSYSDKGSYEDIFLRTYGSGYNGYDKYFGTIFRVYFDKNERNPGSCREDYDVGGNICTKILNMYVSDSNGAAGLENTKSSEIGYIKGTNVIIRQAPNTDSKIIGSFKNSGERVVILSEFVNEGESQALLNKDIPISDGRDTLKKGRAVEKRVVGDGYLYLIEYEIIDEGVEVTGTMVLSKNDIEFYSNKWYEIALNSGKSGWVFGKFISFD